MSVCWWCCHHPAPLHMPVSYDEYKEIFETFGFFCSFECMKAYNFQDSDTNKCSRMALISLMRQRMCNHYNHLQCAPPRQCLKMFGGDMDIDAFRKSFHDADYKLTTVPMIPLSFVIENQTNYKCMKQQDPGDKLSEQKTMSTNPLNIKDKQTQKKCQNPLEKVLGIYPQ